MQSLPEIIPTPRPASPVHVKVTIEQVTGGSRGIGKAIAKALAQEGVDVALLARNPQALADTARELA